MSVTIRKYTDGDVCLTTDATSTNDFETLCGKCWSGVDSETDMNAKVNCLYCKATYQEIKANRKKIFFDDHKE